MIVWSEARFHGSHIHLRKQNFARALKPSLDIFKCPFDHIGCAMKRHNFDVPSLEAQFLLEKVVSKQSD
jgi:hypothetical protein